jgi:Skp family chaperone for outer membrane proteins
MYTKNILLFLFAIFLNISIFAADDNASQPAPQANQQINSDDSNIQKIIEEYKAYVAKIDPKLRDEIIEYRKKISQINRQKRDLYKTLTKEAQEYLATEQKYKKQLPINQKKLIRLQSDEVKTNETDNVTDNTEN